MGSIISAVLVVGGIGLIFGCLLAFASIVFEVKQDKRIEQIQSVLPGANCGACGFAGCSAYAASIVQDKTPVNMCSVGKAPVANAIGIIMGVDAGEVTEKVAKVMCGGNCSSAVMKYEYMGIQDCAAEAKLSGGAKQCPYGCLGLGSCAKVCPFGAISIVAGIAVVDPEKCQACGKCLKTCPKGIIHFVPKENREWVLCSNKDKGAVANKYCSVSCIGCKMCEKVCPSDAIHVVDNLARIDYDKCISCGACAAKCPRKAIVVEGAEKPKTNEEQIKDALNKPESFYRT